MWASEVVPLLRSDTYGELSEATILERLDDRHPGWFGSYQLRILQPRIQGRRTLHGPDNVERGLEDHKGQTVTMRLHVAWFDPNDGLCSTD